MSQSPIVNVGGSAPSRLTIQVVRYSALVAGIGYGILHRRTLQTKYDESLQQREVQRQEDLIKKAKEAYATLQKAKMPPAPVSGCTLSWHGI